MGPMSQEGHSWVRSGGMFESFFFKVTKSTKKYKMVRPYFLLASRARCLTFCIR